MRPLRGEREEAWEAAITSAELRCIVGRIPVGLSESLRADMLTDGYRQEVAAAVVAAIDHASALVALLEACERVAEYELQGMPAIGDGARRRVRAMRDALLAVHATP